MAATITNVTATLNVCIGDSEPIAVGEFNVPITATFEPSVDGSIGRLVIDQDSIKTSIADALESGAAQLRVRAEPVTS